VDEFAAYLKVTRRTVYRMLEDNALPFAFKVKGSWRFAVDDIQVWLKVQKSIYKQSATA
jgi:excisionase family DNA binding protein